jgi:hypothetical protein
MSVMMWIITSVMSMIFAKLTFYSMEYGLERYSSTEDFFMNVGFNVLPKP